MLKSASGIIVLDPPVCSLSGIILFLLLRDFYVPWEAQVAKVEKGRTNVRAGPSISYELLFKLRISPNWVRLIVGQTNDWYMLETQDGVQENCKYSTREESAEQTSHWLNPKPRNGDLEAIILNRTPDPA